jgi:hypothetical protein
MLPRPHPRTCTDVMSNMYDKSQSSLNVRQALCENTVGACCDQDARVGTRDDDAIGLEVAEKKGSKAWQAIGTSAEADEIKQLQSMLAKALQEIDALRRRQMKGCVCVRHVSSAAAHPICKSVSRAAMACADVLCMCVVNLIDYNHWHAHHHNKQGAGCGQRYCTRRRAAARRRAWHAHGVRHYTALA